MTLTVMLAGETKNYAKYETHDTESAFKSDLFVVKMWVPKSQLVCRDESGNVLGGSYPLSIDLEVVNGTEEQEDDLPF